MSIRVLALLGDSFGASGGIAQFNRDLISAWSSLDSVIEVVLVPRFYSEVDSELPAKVVQKVPMPPLLLYILGAIRTATRRPAFDFIFCGHLNMIQFATFLSRLVSAPVWLQLHGTEAWTKPSRSLQWSAEQSEVVTCVSRHTRRMFLQWAKLPSEKVLVLPNTVDEQFTTTGSHYIGLAQHEMMEKRAILTVSRLSRREGYKGHDKVIRCLPALCAEFDDLIYVIAGEGDLRQDLERLAESLHVSHVVKFLGRVERSTLPSLYRNADVFIMPSTGEGFGIVFLESIACGTPVIAGDSDGARDPLQDGALGVLSSDKDLMACIREALNKDCSAMALERSNARRAEAVARNFGKHAFLANVSSILERLLGPNFNSIRRLPPNESQRVTESSNWRRDN
jgi:phosphatidylinositol alpha-1,6-mannosyltransferase